MSRAKKPAQGLVIPGLDTKEINAKPENNEIKEPVLFPPVEIHAGRVITETDYQMIAKHHEIYNAIQESKFCLRKRKYDFEMRSLGNLEMYMPHEIHSTTRRKKKIKQEDLMGLLEAVEETNENEEATVKEEDKKENKDEEDDEDEVKKATKEDDDYDFDDVQGNMFDDDEVAGDEDAGGDDDAEPTF